MNIQELNELFFSNSQTKSFDLVDGRGVIIERDITILDVLPTGEILYQYTRKIPLGYPIDYCKPENISYEII